MPVAEESILCQALSSSSPEVATLCVYTRRIVLGPAKSRIRASVFVCFRTGTEEYHQVAPLRTLQTTQVEPLRFVFVSTEGGTSNRLQQSLENDKALACLLARSFAHSLTHSLVRIKLDELSDRCGEKKARRIPIS